MLPFRFKNEQGTRTTHHLVFVSKSFKGYDIMKNIMASHSSKRDQGVPSFEYNEADEKFLLLFELTRPLHELEPRLTKRFAGRTLTTREIYEEDSVGLPYIEKNYKEVLKKLEGEGKITTASGDRTRRKGTFPNWLRVTFPRQDS